MRLIALFFALLTSLLSPAWAQSFPPSPKQLVAVNPITNKIYVANESANTVTVLDAAANTSTTIPVGSRPQFIVVNPLTNRIFVNNGGEASITVIDGATDTNLTPTPLQIGSQGPMAINNETNIVYIVRMTSLATDEVTFFNASNNTWYTIATESFQPTALTINPVTNKLYVAHYGTGDVRVISGEFNNTNLHPATTSIPAWSHPFAIAANWITNKVYVITEDSRGPIGIIDGATNNATFTVPAAGHGMGPKALAVNPVTNKAYAAFANEVVVISGDGTYSYVPVPTGGTTSIAINYLTNKVYVSSDGATLTVIDGFTNATTALAVPAGTLSLGVNPITNEVIAAGGTTAFVDGIGESFAGITPTTTITPLPSNTSGPNPTLTMNASAGTVTPVRGIFYQVDSIEGRWTAATGSGTGPYSAALSGLSSGSHTVYAFAADAHIAPTDTGQQSSPMTGSVTSYTFTVNATTATATVNLASSANPSNVGQSVTFTASVLGSGASPTGTVTFKDGAATLCSAVVLASASAACSTSALSAGSHTITATYSGDSTYGTASGSVPQTVNKLAATASLASTPNPSVTGQSVTFTATISGGSGTPTGTVTFLDGTATVCSAVTLASGSAACTTSALTVGSHTITANYSGSSTYAAVSASRTQVVDLRTPTVTVTSNLNPSQTGQSVTFTAVVGGAGGPTPTGTVNFTDGESMLCASVALTSGSATCTTASLAAGTHTVGASYSGNATYKTGSGVATQNVFAPGPPAKSEITSPAPGSVLSSTTVEFAWTAGSQVAERYLMVGTTQGGSQLYAGYQGSATSHTVNNIPQDGHTVYVRLMSYLNGMWQAADYTYATTGNAPPPPPPTKSTMTSPAGGSTIGASTTFTWDPGVGVSERYLMVGTTMGASQVYAGYQGNATSRTVSGIPQDGSTIYVRLMSYIDGTWYIADYTYVGGSGTPPPPAQPQPSAMTSPAPGSTLAGSTVTFMWSAGNSVSERFLAVGTTPGGSNLYGAYQGGGTSATVSGLPTDGRTIYVRLMSWMGGGWSIADYSYRAAGP